MTLDICERIGGDVSFSVFSNDFIFDTEKKLIKVSSLGAVHTIPFVVTSYNKEDDSIEVIPDKSRCDVYDLFQNWG